MNEDILYQQYLSNNTDSPISIEEFTSLKSIMSPEDFNNFVGLKKKENSQETPSNSLGLGENQPTPISAQGNPQITSVPISQDLDLNQAQIEAMQGVQNPASLNLELPQQSVNQNGSLESNGEVNTSSSALEDSFDNFIQQGGVLPLNPTSTKLNVLPRAYEEQFNNRTTATPQKEVGNVSLPKKSRIDLTTFDTNGLQEIPIPTKSISDELGNVVAKINNDVVKAYKTPSGQTILQTGVGLIPEEVYLSLKDKEGKQRTPQSKDVYENINGVFVEQDYSEVPIDETLKQRLEPHDIENPKWINRNYGNLQGEKYVNSILQKEKEGKVKVARNEKGELIDEYLKPILDNSNVLWQPVGSYINKYNNDVNEVNKEIELYNQKISTRNAIRNSAYVSSVYEAAELEKNARENFISRYGQANYDRYGVLPPQVMDRLQQEEMIKNYVSQGYTEQEAVQYANTYRERELQGVREENNFIINNIFSKLKSEDSQEKKAWITLAKSYPKEFRDFFNEYTEKFGDEAWDNSYLLKRFDNPMRRASIKDEFINYLRTLQVYSQIELKNKAKQAKADVRFGAENKNADLINQGYAKLNNLNIVSKFIQGENNAIATLEDQTKPLFKQAYEKGIENAQLESSANRNEFLGTLELGAKKIGNLPVRVIGNLFQSATSFFTGNSDWSKYVNEDIEFSKNAFELNKNAEELRTEVVTYKDKQGNVYKLRDGNIYKVDKNGYEFYKPELDNNSFKANLTEVSRDKEWNFTSVTAQGAQLIAEVYLMNRLGTSSGNLMSKPFGSYAVRVAKELGTESRYYNILKSAYKGIRASENASPFGMAAYTFGGMTKRNNDLGYDGLESWFKGIFDSGMMYAANRFFPDARFFKDGDRVQKTAFNLLKNGDKKGALQTIKNFFIDASYYTKNSLPDVGGEMFQEMGLEPLFQGVSDVVSGAFKQDKKIWEKAIDPNNFVDLSPETALLTALSTGTIKGVQNLKTSPLASFEGMTDLEKVILSTNMEGLPDALRFISNDASFAGLQGSKATRRLLEMQTAKKYLDQLPKDNTLTLSQTADVITNLQKLENLKKEQEKATSESVKKQYQEQIDSVEETIAKTFEESKNNTIVDEQPQQATQQQPTQETTQGKTTETNLQPEQTTVATEQSVSADVDANQTLPINETTQNEPQQSNVGNTQTLEIIGNKANETTLPEENEEEVADVTEEEQIKINLERLNAYIEAKKQREQEQQVQVSPSAEMGNVQQNTENKNSETNTEINKTYSINDLTDDEYKNIPKEILEEFIALDNQISNLNLYDENDIKKGNELKARISQLRSENGLDDLTLNHGTPHDFEKFVTEKIGTGEGNQAFGWGLYFAQNEKIAQNYAKILDKDKNGIVYTVKIKDGKVKKFVEWRDITDGDEIENIASKFTDEDTKKYNDYLANIDYSDTKDHTGLFKDVLDEINDGSYGFGDVKNVAFGNAYNDLSDALGQDRASELMKEAGYSGIKYKSNKGKGKTYNYVIFDPNDIVIVSKKRLNEKSVWSQESIQMEKEKINYEYEDFLKNQGVQQKEAFSGNEQVQTIEQPSETQNAPLVSESKSTNGKYTIKVEQNNGIGTAKILDNNGNEVKLQVKLQVNQKQITDNVIATIDNITLPDGESGFKVTVTDTQGNLIEDKNGDYEFEFNTQEEVDKFISQKEKGYKLSKNRVVAEKPIQVSPSSQYEGAVTYTQFGEGQEGTIYYENGVAKIKDKSGKIYSANSPLVKNLKDVDGNTIQLQKSNERLTPITKQAFDALVKILQKAFPRFAKVTYDLEQAKQRAVELGENITDLEFKTSNGNVYGFKLSDGTIYLNPQFLNANTPIHEFSHLFEQLLPSRFKNGVELLKQTNLGKKLFEQLKQEGNYANLTDEQLWGEALNTHIGNFGENEVNNIKGRLKKLQDWIKDFFAKVGDVLGIKKLSPDTQLRMFTEGVVKDLLGGKPIVAENQVSPSEQVQYSLNENDRKAKQLEIINKTNPAPNSYNTWVRTVNDIKTPEEAFKSAFEDGEMYPDFTVDDMQKVLNTGKVTIYSSYPIKEGVFVTPSKMNAEDYAGGRGKKVYSKEIDAKDIAWIDESEGQYAPVNSSEVLAEIQAEREVIKAEAQANGTFMKAPNGKATNLNEAQWIDVRTKRFKDWFGDWEKDAKNASKVVDENGEPMIVYHGTGAKRFNEFTHLSYFTDSKNIADSYSKQLQPDGTSEPNLFEVFLNIRNLKEMEMFTLHVDRVNLFEKKKRTDGTVNPLGTTGFVEFVTRNPNQIKSATENVGTYSANNNDIRFSINSKTPLSVKEQTEVINDLVANGEDSAFAKLQETNWYKGLSEEQKQNVTPTNIAETIVNAVNSTKKNLEQKVERRDAKIEKLQIEKEDITKTLKDKIKELKSEYKNKINELKNSDKTFKEKFAEKLYWKRQATNAIKLILKDKYIRKNVTDNDIVKLLNLSDRIYRDNDVNVAFDNFEKYLDKVMGKEDEKTRREKEKYDNVYSKVEEQFNNGVSLSEIIKSYEKDTDKERAKKAYYEIQGKKITPEQAVEMMEKINKAEEEMLNPKRSFKDRMKTIRQGFNQKLLDRQWLPKQLLEKVGAMDTFNRLINFGGASSKAKMLFDRAYGKIWFGLGIEDIKTLNNIIQNKRVISIAENRAKRGLEPINNTVSEITINAQGKNMMVKQMMTKDTAQAYLDGVKAKIGEKKFNKLSQRADSYFAEFKTLLDALLDNGMIRQEAYDSMVEIDYQPRVFLEHLLDYDQKLSKEEQEFRNKTNGLTKDLIKMLDDGSEGVLLSNSQLLLASAINSRVQAIAMNDINKKFITKDFPKAKIRFEGIDPKNFKNAEERRFYKYFKELESKVIVPNGNTIDAKQGYSKAYYFENGIRKEFLLEDELHGLWHDKVRGLNPDIKQKLSYATGSSILKGMATGYNPAFIIVNTPRDFLHTLSFSPEYRGVVLWEGALLATDFARATVPLVGSIYKFNKGKDNVVRKYFEYGGVMDFLNQQGIADRDNAVRGTYQRLLKYLPQMVQDKMSADAVGKFLNTIALRPLSNYSELGFRIANFTRALENQLSDYNKDNKTKYKSIDEIPDKEIVDNMYNYAVKSTRGLLDFNQGGTFVKDAESVLPYINAGVQGTRAAVQAFRKDPIGVSSQVAQIVTMTSVTFFGIGLYFMGLIRPDDEDEDKETLINNYLDFRESLTPEQKKNYFALPVGYNKVDNSYEVFLVAKSQPLTPLFILSEEVSENILRRQVGKKEKPIEDIISSMGRAFSDNIDPTSLSTLITGNGRTFADNAKTTAGKLASRNPVFKGVATSLSGYDFYFNQPLQDTQSGKLSKFEGQSSNRVEQFYKDFGLASDFSPVRTKAFIESIVTSPTTNPWVGIFYAGSDAIFTDVTAKEAIRDFLGYNKQKDKWMFREAPAINRAIKETSDFSRQLNQAENIKTDDKYVKALEETEYMRMKSDEIVSGYVDKAKNAQYQDEADAFVRQGLEASLEYVQDKYKDDPIRGKQFMDRAINKLRNYDTIGTVWDIKYSAENNPEAQAILIYSYFGDIQQNEDSERIIRSLKTAGLTSSSIMSYYQKIVEENNK